MVEQRKLIRLGNSSFAIALPKGWIDKAGLKKGDNIFISPNANGELIIMPSPLEKTNGKERIIDLKDKNLENIKKEIRAAYIRGYTSFIIKGIKSKDEKNEIKKILADFLSFELIESNGDEIIAKDFFNLDDANLSNFIRRMDNNIREISEIVLEEIKKDKINPHKIKEVEDIDKDVNKFYFLCSRIFLIGTDNPTILTSLKTSGLRIFNEWWIAFHLEALADNLKYLLRLFQKMDVKKEEKEKIEEVCGELREAYKKGMDSFYKEDTKLALEVMDITHRINEDLIKLEKQLPHLLRIIMILNEMKRQIYQNAKMVSYIKY